MLDKVLKFTTILLIFSCFFHFACRETPGLENEIPERENTENDIMKIELSGNQPITGIQTGTLTLDLYTLDIPLPDYFAQQAVYLGGSVILDSGAFIAAGLDREWQFFKSAPMGYYARFNTVVTSDTSYRFTPANSGYYYVKLVSTGKDRKVIADGCFIVINANLAPVAVITSPATGLKTGDSILLSAENSSDPEGDALTYAWSLNVKPRHSAAVLTTNSTASTALTCDRPGYYTVRLTVNDGHTDSGRDESTAITVYSFFVEDRKENYNAVKGIWVECDSSYAAIENTYAYYNGLSVQDDAVEFGIITDLDSGSFYGNHKNSSEYLFLAGEQKVLFSDQLITVHDGKYPASFLVELEYQFPTADTLIMTIHMLISSHDFTVETFYTRDSNCAYQGEYIPGDYTSGVYQEFADDDSEDNDSSSNAAHISIDTEYQLVYNDIDYFEIDGAEQDKSYQIILSSAGNGYFEDGQGFYFTINDSVTQVLGDLYMEKISTPYTLLSDNSLRFSINAWKKGRYKLRVVETE